MPKRDDYIVPCDCDRDRDRDRKPVLLSIDPIIGPVGGGDPTRRTTIRGEHLAGVRTVKFGRAKVRAGDFVSQTDTTIVLEAPIALATVPEGVAPDFPLENAVIAKTRRHKSKPLTYTYSASAGGDIFNVAGSCSQASTLTVTFTDTAGKQRGLVQTYDITSTPLVDGKPFVYGSRSDPTYITAHLSTGETQCYIVDYSSDKSPFLNVFCGLVPRRGLVTTDCPVPGPP